MVRCTALLALTRVVSSITSLPPSEGCMFSEYLLPSLSLVPSDAEESVRQACALAVARMVGTAQWCLEQGGGGGGGGGGGEKGGRGTCSAAEIVKVCWVWVFVYMYVCVCPCVCLHVMI